MNWIENSTQTFYLPFRALKIIFTHGRIFLLCLAPLLISIGLAWFLGHWIQGWIWEQVREFSYFQNADPTGFFYRFSYYLLMFLISILAALCFNTIALIVSAPFNDWISEETEKTLGKRGSRKTYNFKESQTTTDALASPHPTPAISYQTWIKWFRIMGIDIKKAVFATFVQIVSVTAGLLFFWIPIVPVLVALLLGWSVTFQFISYPQTRKMQGLDQSLRWIWRNPLQSFVYGSVFGFLLSIPLVAAFIMPVAVVAGTILESEG